MNVRVLILLCLVTSALPAFAGQGVSLRVTPSVGFAPANLIVRATVDSNKDNRAIEIIAESEDFYRSSEMSLDGDRAPRVTMMQFKSVPEGEYHVRAVIKGVSGRQLAQADTTVHIVGEDGL
jgi:hypothetical protein